MSPERDPVLGCMELVCELVGHAIPAQALGAGFAVRADGRIAPEQLPEVALAHGLAARLDQRSLNSLTPLALPVTLLLIDGRACVLTALPSRADGADAAQRQATILLPESGLAAHRIDWAELQQQHSGQMLYLKPRAELDRRGDFDVTVSPKRWFWDILSRYRHYYVHVAIATVVVNLLALVGSVFAMIVYDRVVPNQAYNTLWVLAVGVGLAAGFEFAARMLRAWLTDVAGKKADIVMSSVLFRRVMGLRLDQRPTSAGSFANTLREYESVRDFVTSATLLALADMPFVVLFLALLAYLGGPLAWVPAGAMAVIVLATALAQWPMSRLQSQYMRGMSRKQSIAVESVEGLEALRATGAEAMMQSRWDDSTGQMAAFSAQSRLINAWMTSLVALVQQLTNVVVVVWGVYLIHDNLLTMGGLIAVSILSSRAIAPVSQVVGLGLRWQQARTAMKSLNDLMAKPQEREADRDYVHAPSLKGALALQQLTHRYGDKDSPTSLSEVNLSLQAGERVAVLGKVGSGKSTLLRIAAGLLPVSEGSVALDGLDLRQIEPTDVRAQVAYLGQDAALFHGTLKDNILMGARQVSAARLSQALQLTGLDRVAAAHPRGLDLPIGEHGVGLSGGQRQLVALARLFVRDPRIVLLDEPTSAMDNATEAQIMQAMRAWLPGRTLVLVTHRLQWVGLAERVVVVDGGKVVADGPREVMMQRLTQGLHVPAKGNAAGPQQRPAPMGVAPANPASVKVSAASDASANVSTALTATITPRAPGHPVLLSTTTGGQA